MSISIPNFQEFLYSDTAFPLPDWEAVAEWIEIHLAPDEAFDGWTEFARQWLGEMNQCFSNEYEVFESENILLFCYPGLLPLKSLARFAEYCCAEIENQLPGLGKYDTPGKLVVTVFAHVEDYYSHVADYYPEGEFGGSSGSHIRTKYSHVALLATRHEQALYTLAHELTHAALGHLRMPLWLEEGLTQFFEHDLAGKPFDFDPQEVGEQKAYWRQNSLDEFWSGEGFHKPTEVQKYSYQLAEILMRLLLTDFRPRWFGADRRPVVQLMNFLRDAKIDDAGEAAAVEHLKLTLQEIAAKSIGNVGLSGA